MAHFAQLDENNVVLQVIVVNNNDCKDADGNESEDVGIAFCKSLFGENTNWKQTSYNANIRKNYAGIGFKYHQETDAFVPPAPYPSWILDQQSTQWVAPTPYPQDGNSYVWNDTRGDWDIDQASQEIVQVQSQTAQQI